MNSPLNDIDLPELMTVRPLAEADCFEGLPETYGMLGIYGGHFVGQARAAAFETVDAGKLAQSFHCYFMRRGDPAQPIHYQVTRLKQGRGIEIRQVNASQAGETAFTMLASFKTPEAGDEHQPVMPAVISPDALLEDPHHQGKRFNPPMMVADRARLLLISDSFVPDEFVSGRDAVLQNWMMSTHQRDITDRETQCVLGFLSDNTLMFNSVLPYGIPFQTHRLTTLDHSVWFHSLPDTREWMLFDQRSTAAADGRGMNEGQVYGRDGRLIFTATQESMLRKI